LCFPSTVSLVPSIVQAHSGYSPKKFVLKVFISAQCVSWLWAGPGTATERAGPSLTSAASTNDAPCGLWPVPKQQPEENRCVGGSSESEAKRFVAGGDWRRRKVLIESPDCLATPSQSRVPNLISGSNQFHLSEKNPIGSPAEARRA
jgi:hypothetical protein